MTCGSESSLCCRTGNVGFGTLDASRCPTGRCCAASSSCSTPASIGSAWNDAGVPVHVLRRIAGHGSLSTTQRYLRPRIRKITAAEAALSAHFSALRAPRSLPSLIAMTR